MLLRRGHLCGVLNKKNTGEKVVLAGWVRKRRDHGGLIFIDLGDKSGRTQVVFNPEINKEAHIQARSLREGWIIAVAGKVETRPSDSINLKLSTGEIEVMVENLEILNISQSLPFPIENKIETSEEVRLKYRYLDLRRPIMQKNLKLRYEVTKEVRNFLDKKGFMEIETPFLTRSTPEGARDYVLTEEMLANIFKRILGISLPIPFPRFSHEEAVNLFGTDRPDIRFGLELKDISELASKTEFGIFQKALEEEGQVKGLRLPGGTSLSRKDLDELSRWITLYGAKGLSWVLLTEKGAKSPLLKFIPQGILSRIIESMEGEKGDALFFIADKKEIVAESLAHLRLHLAKKFNLIPENTYKPVWVVDFPLFERDEEGELTPCHHPFTSPREEDLPLLEEAPEKVKARSYDIVLNGEEIGGGSIRIHRRKVQERVLKILGIDAVKARERFGFLLDALSFGAPPHGGIAFGLDRLVMILAGVESIREVIPFPKTQKAVSLLTQAPSPVDEEQLKELHIQLREEESSPE